MATKSCFQKTLGPTDKDSKHKMMQGACAWPSENHVWNSQRSICQERNSWNYRSLRSDRNALYPWKVGGNHAMILREACKQNYLTWAVRISSRVLIACSHMPSWQSVWAYWHCSNCWSRHVVIFPRYSN